MFPSSSNSLSKDIRSPPSDLTANHSYTSDQDIDKSQSYNYLDKSLDLSLSNDNQTVFTKINEMERRELIQKINTRLLAIFGEVPPYETKPDVLVYLSQLLENYDHSIKVNKNLLSSYDLQTTYYREEKTRFQNELELFGASLNSLSKELVSCLNNLATAAIYLGAKDTQLASLQFALADYQLSIASLKDQILLYQFEINHLTKTLYHIQSDNTHLVRKISDFKSTSSQFQQKIKQWERDTKILLEKSVDYETNIQDLENVWDSSQVDANSLRLKDLKELKTEILNKQAMLSKLDQDVSCYNQLPPDLHLATLKLERAKTEEARLRNIKEDLVSRIIPDY